jgi:5'-AMP-activated protein kinase catalytic alpha subunit
MGKRIGQYVLGKQLGAGNFSTVRLAVDTNTGESWAIKIIDKDRLEKEHLHEQLKREIVILKALNHPNVVFMKEVMQTKNHIYIVLELVTGGELFGELCQARRFDEERARKYFQQLIVGLHHCHTNGVAHRDLKLENLLLDSQGVLKINDFGLSNFQSTNEKLQTCCGTPNDVAPEVLLDAGYNGKIACC